MEPNPMQAHYEAVLGDLRDRKDREIQDATSKITQKYESLIAAVQAAAGGETLNISVADASTVSESVSVSPTMRITTGEFHGMSYTSAARAILERSPNKAPLTTQEILAYIQKSGRKVEGKNPAGTIYSSLKRGPDFELVAKNTWGLAAWYNIKRKSKQEKASSEPQQDEPELVPLDQSEVELQEA